ncbi:PLxRFG domain-containing protein [Cupriavidus basilensis]
MALQDFGSLSLTNTPTGAQGKAAGPRAGKTTPLDAAVVDRIIAEEGADAIRPTVMSIYGQESDGGTNARRSVDNAIGPMQVIESTFNRLKRGNERVDNPEDNFRVGVRYLKTMADKFGNDTGRLAAGYFSGEGNVATSGDTPYKEDRKDGNGKYVSAYVRDVLGRVGNAAVPGAKAAEPAPDISKAPKYRDFIGKPQWGGLDDAQKEQARNAYFDRYLAPHLAPAERDAQRAAFLDRAAQIEGTGTAKTSKPGLIDRAVGAINSGLNAVLPSGGAPLADPMGTGAPEITAAAGPEASKIGVMGTQAMPAAPGASRAPVTPEFRAELGRAFDAATPAQREQMQQAEGVVGQLARERAGQFAAAPQVDTAKKFDTRAEARTDRMRAEGVDPKVAENFGRYGAAAGQAPGSELGTMGASNFDFETQQRFNKDPVFSNPVIRAAVKGYQGYRQGSLGLAQALFDATGNQEFADIAKQGVADAQRTTTAMGEKGDGLQRNFEGAVSSIAQQLPALLAGVATGTEVLPLAAMFTQTFGQEYGSGRAQGLDGGQAAARAGIYGAFEVIGEKFGLGQTLQALKLAVKGAPTQDIATVLAQGMLREIPGEQLTTLGQFLTDKVPGIGTNLEAGLAQYLQQAGDTLAQTVMQGGLMMGGTTGVSAGVRHLQGDPTQATQDLAAEQAREQALNKSAAFFQPPARPKHASTAAAEQVVREMAAEAGIDPAELLPAEKPVPVAPVAAAQPAPATPAPQAQPNAAPAEQGAAPAGQPAYDPREVMDFAQTRYERLLAKRDGEALVQAGEDGRPVDGEVAGQALTPDEQRELAVLEQSGGDAGALARFYGFDEDTANGSASPVPPESVDSRGAAPDAGMATDPAAGRAGPVPGSDGRQAGTEAAGAPNADAVPGADGAADGQPALSKPAGALPRVSLPGFIGEHVDRARALGDRSGLTQQVYDLSAQGYTAAEVMNRVADKAFGPIDRDAEMNGENVKSARIQAVRSLRTSLGIPSQDDPAEFKAWQDSVRATAAETAPPTAPASTDPAAASDEQLRARLDYMREQARANGGWNKMAAEERNRIDAELARRAAAATPPAADPSQALDAAAHEAATSPANSLPEPTDAQKQAGNYKMGHATLHGLDITIENPRGSTRSGTDTDGKAWSVEMANHYGYIKRTEGADGDHVDVFIGPKPESTKVFVVDQVDPRTGKYDEHKVLMGFSSLAAARAGYLANYEQGWKGAGAITPMSMDEFKAWLKEGDTTKPLNPKVGKPKTEKQAKAAREAAKAERASNRAAPADKPTSEPEFGSEAYWQARADAAKPKTEKQAKAAREAAKAEKVAPSDLPRERAGLAIARHEVRLARKKLSGDVDYKQTLDNLPPVPEGHVRLFRGSADDVGFHDVFDEKGLGDHFSNLPGVSYTPNIKFADYYRASYGKSATIHYIDVPAEVAESLKIDAAEYKVDVDGLNSQGRAAREQAKPVAEAQAPDAAAPLPISPSSTPAAASPPAKPKPKTEKQLRSERADAAPVAKGVANKAAPAEDRPLFSRAPGTNTEAFKRWFGKSEIVDAAGKPRVMYHGTGADITSLQGKQAGAIFLTYAPSVAEGYAHTSTQWLSDRGMEGAPNILPVYVKAENPFDYESAKHRTQLITAAIAGGKTYVMGDGRRAMLGEDGSRTLYTVGAIEAGLTTGANNWSLIEEPWFQDAIKRAGFDSFYVHEEGFKNLGVYEPSQVKSATGNIGAFDASNPDIRFRRGAPAGRLNAEDLRAQFAPIIKQWQNGPKGGVEVVQSVDDLPSHLAEALRSAGEDGRVEGFYLPKSDKVYLIADNLPSAERAQQVAFHEVYGHKGLRAILPAEQYASMMDRIRRANPKIAAAADDWFDAYGGDTIRMSRAAGQVPAEARRNAELLAVEEALADMAATVPVAGPVRKLLAALQAGLRKIGLHAVADWLEGKTEAETFALLRDARAAVFGKTSKGETHVSQAPADDAAPAFSRSRDGAQMNLFRLFQRDEGSVDTMGKWDRTVGTQYNKALKDQHFGKVFGYALAMQNEVSMASIRPAELAPGLLHKVDGFKPALRALVLGRKRDKELEGATMAIFSGSTAGATVAQGRIWSKEDLQQKFGLTDRGIRLYNQARAAINASLDEVAAAEAYAMSQGFVPKGLRRTVMDDPASARSVLMGSLDKQIRMLERATKAAARGKSEEERASTLEAVLEPYIATRDRLEEIFERAASLKLAGYAPLMRFGKYTVYANEVGPNGEVLRDENDDAKSLYFGVFETEAEAIRKADELRAKYADQGNVRVTRGKKDQKGSELFSGISPETVALFGDVVGQDEATKKFYQKALSERSALKRRLGRRAIDGYSTDLPRVLSNFITSNGRLAAQRYYLRDLNNAIRTIPKSKGDVKDEAIELRNYLMDANDAGSGASSLMFAYFLGGSVASAVVNLTQPFMMTAPYLSQWGAARTTAAMAKAMPYALGKKQIADPDLRAALKRGSQEGIVEAQEIFHLYSQGAQTVSASIASRLAKIPKVGKGLQSSTESARARLEGFFTLWGSMFAAAESFNRKLTFVAAWDVAKATKQPDPYDFAVRAVNETQGIFNKVNRPNWARGTTGRLLMTFKQYSIMYLELTRRMWRAGPAGKRAVLMMMAVLFLAGGEEGLPFAQDINDLVDTIGQSLGYDTNLLRDKRKWAHKILGQTGGDFALYGVSSMMPLDFAGRLGMGNLVPGTGLLKPAESADRTREVTDVIGPAGALVSSAMDAYDAWSAKQPGRAVMALMPKAINNAAAGLEMAMTDKAVDYKGRKVTDVGLGDAIIKGVGFTPTKVSEDTRRRMPARQDISLVKKVQADIVDLWTRGLAEGDKDMQERAAAWFRDWNEKNPDSPIQITNKQLLGKVRQMATPSADRMLKAAPKGLRGRLAGELSTAEEE